MHLSYQGIAVLSSPVLVRIPPEQPINVRISYESIVNPLFFNEFMAMTAFPNIAEVPSRSSCGKVQCVRNATECKRKRNAYVECVALYKFV